MTPQDQKRLGKILWSIAAQCAIRLQKRGHMQHLFPLPTEIDA